MKLSVVIPAYNEEETVVETLTGVVTTLSDDGIDHEVIVVDDSSTDSTAAVVESFAKAHPQVRCLPSPYDNGFGFAVRAGLDAFEGDAVAIVMADGSDSPADLVRYQRLLEEGYECAFGSRFVPQATRTDYPRAKLVFNRTINFSARVLFRHGYNDTTNAFKAYRREVIEDIRPFRSNHFSLTVELPLKAVLRGSSYSIVPISWTNRKAGVTKMSLSDVSSYYSMMLRVFLDHHLGRG